MLHLLESMGDKTLYVLESTGRMGVFLVAAVFNIFMPPYKVFHSVRQIHFIGSRSLLVILVTGLFTGMVLGLQGYYTLNKFGSEELLGSAVALGLVRELGPVLASLVVIGRAGSAMCAEIGIMRHTEQIDALQCMAISPFNYLISPKFVGALISLPLLTMIFDCIGIAGGFLVGVVQFGVNEGAYFQGMYESVVWDDVFMGFVKSLVFGLLIVWISTAKGYYVHLSRRGGFGSEGVSRVTTDAVVLASVAILVWDYLIGAVLL